MQNSTQHVPGAGYRTEAVELALKFVRSTGKSAIRQADGQPSRVADLVAFALLRGSESVQLEIDAYADALDRELPGVRGPVEHYVEQIPQGDGRYIADCPACGWHGVKAPLPASIVQGEGHLRGRQS